MGGGEQKRRQIRSLPRLRNFKTPRRNRVNNTSCVILLVQSSWSRNYLRLTYIITKRTNNNVSYIMVFRIFQTRLEKSHVRVLRVSSISLNELWDAVVPMAFREFTGSGPNVLMAIVSAVMLLLSACGASLISIGCTFRNYADR